MTNHKIIMCNWKANMSALQIHNFFTQLSAVGNNKSYSNLFIFPSFLHISLCVDLKNKFSLNSLSIGSQDVSKFANGAYTGDVTSQMLTDFGVKYSLIGHSERRNTFGDDNLAVTEKLLQCNKNSILPIICIGETLNQLNDGVFEDVIMSQLNVLQNCNFANVADDFVDQFIIAYEPVWAIGTGKIPKEEEINSKHEFIKNFVKQKFNKTCKVLYGGSVNETNYNSILQISSVDGILVGGASMKAENVIKFCS